MLPVIRIKQSCFTILELMTKLSPVETNAIGWCRQINKNTWEVSRVVPADYTGRSLFPGYDLSDEPTGVSVVVDPVVKQREIELANKAGFDLNFHYHSHVNMQAFWSSTDRNMQNNWTGKYLCAVVGNKSKEYLACVVEAYITGAETRKAEIQVYGKDLTWQEYESWKSKLKAVYDNHRGRRYNGLQETIRHI